MSFASLIPWRNKRQENESRELNSLADLSREIDRAFGAMFRGSFGWGDNLLSPQGFGEVSAWSPSLDMTEDDHSITVRAEVPGVDPKDLNLTVTGNTLVLSGEKREQSEKNENGCYHSERRFGSFRRSVALPGEVNSEKVTADYANGILTVKMEKAPTAQSKRIAVKTA
jgi:HSP20 family protein